MTKVSVCITTYNRMEPLDRTLASLAEQTRLPDELIISDDCSPRDPVSVVEKWRDHFPNLRYHRNTHNLYMPGNLNQAISLATGAYIANLHDADEFAPSLLEEWENALDQYPTAGFVFCGIGGWPAATDFGNGVILHDVQPLTAGDQFFEQNYLHKFGSIVWGTVMARRSAYETLLPFDPSFGFVSDVDMWMRMCLYYDVAYIRKPLIILDHSPTPERSAGKFNWTSVDMVRRMQEANIRRFYKDQPDRLRSELRHHAWLTEKIFAKHLYGRMRRSDWGGLKEGLQLCRNLQWPLKGLWVLGNF